MGEGAAFFLFAASKNHATSETAPLGQREWLNPLRHGYAVPPLPKGRGSGEGVKFIGLQVGFF